MYLAPFFTQVLKFPVTPLAHKSDSLISGFKFVVHS